MVDEEWDMQHLGQLRLTWEHIFAAFVLSGPYRAEAASKDLRLAHHTLLSILRSQVTAAAILAEPDRKAELLSAAHYCAQDLPAALEHDHASAPQSDTHLGKELNALERSELYAEAKNRLFFGVGDSLAFLLASMTGSRFSPPLDSTTFARIAFEASFDILAGHPARATFAAWIEAEKDEHRSLRHFAHGRENSLALLHYFGEEKRWSFWRAWYQSFLDGEPLDWDLQRRVVLIKDPTWRAGSEAVAKEIENIQTTLDLEKRIEELEEDLRRATVNRHGIGGNMPPEPVENVPIAQELVIVWQPLEEIKLEMASDDPDPTRLQKAIHELVKALKMGLAWCLNKGDLIVDTAIKWAIPTGGGYLALNPEKLEAVIETAKKLVDAL
ncbi:hypothetical protein [uncultured Roseobacter sp.]|uniref:hypothetical protein n=1 Tax=uncultured Roseobacter sp. TaxID=114847 RepID=UPI00260470F5|nr:hypothetical protein [uncultured Roseobacter sp.]